MTDTVAKGLLDVVKEWREFCNSATLPTDKSGRVSRDATWQCADEAQPFLDWLERLRRRLDSATEWVSTPDDIAEELHAILHGDKEREPHKAERKRG